MSNALTDSPQWAERSNAQGAGIHDNESVLQANERLKRAEQESRERASQVQKHRDVLLELAQLNKSDFHHALRRICSEAAASLETARVSYWSLIENDSAIFCECLFLLATRSGDESSHGVRLGVADCPAYFDALKAKRPIVANRVLEHPATCGLAGYLNPLGISSMLDLPVWVRGEVVGVLCHEHVGPSRQWTPEEIDFASALAAMVSIALEESRRAQSESRLRESEEKLIKALAREKELGRLRNNFVSMVSHEFRTPLGIIQSSAEILEDYLDQLDPSERREHLQSIQKNTRRMAGLMEEVLLIGSIDAGKFDFTPTKLDLAAFARRLVDEVLSATDRRCPIELVDGELPSETPADERLLRHVFTNLLTNAVKYSEVGQAVHFDLRAEGSEIVAMIRDGGIGIPEADQEWLFNAFHRGRNVGDRPGTGLGLLIVKRCVDLHGGTIKVESEAGEGTIVTVRLPRTDRVAMTNS